MVSIAAAGPPKRARRRDPGEMNLVNDAMAKLDGPTRAHLVALDLDGTVLSPAGHVTPRTRDAIRAVSERGIRVCICTGRTWSESRDVVAEGQLTGPGVFVGGAVVNEMHSGAILAHSRIEPSLAREICATFHADGLAAMAYQAGGHDGADWLVSSEHAMPPGVTRWLAHFGSAFRRVDALDRFDHAYTVRISTDGPIARCDAVVARLAERFGPRIYLHQITVPSEGIEVVEVFDAAVNKWQGLLQVAELTGVDPRAIVAVGDDMNDLPMLANAAVGIAMGNAKPVVKVPGRRVIGSNADDGLAAFLEELARVDGAIARLA